MQITPDGASTEGILPPLTIRLTASSQQMEWFTAIPVTEYRHPLPHLCKLFKDVPYLNLYAWFISEQLGPNLW